MSLDTYDGLKASVADWLGKSNLASQIPSFISLAEVRASRVLKIKAWEKRSTLTMIAGDEFYALPDGFLGMRSAFINGNPKKSLSFESPEEIYRTWAGSQQAKPAMISIVGDELLVAPTPDSDYTIEVAHYAKPTPLSASNQTNWFTNTAPDVLLYGALVESAPYLNNDNRIAIWQGLYERAISDLKRHDKQSRWSGGALQTRPQHS